MTAANSTATPFAGRELVITRIFDAPRELVFEAWTNPKYVARWWGPHEFTNPVCELDVRPGGALYIEMTGPDGVAYPVKGVFNEVVKHERLVFTEGSFEDEAGNPQLEGRTTVTFADHGDGKTRLTLHTVILKSTPEVEEALAGMEEGWNESLDRLAESLTHIKGETSMTENTTPDAAPQTPTPDAALKRLGDTLLGTWELSGETEGQVTYEWMEGGFFLMQHVNLKQDGQPTKGLEMIGRERTFGSDAPSEDIKSRYYGPTGETLDYVYELEGKTLTIWGGEKGSPAFYRGTFSDDGNTLSGDWQWPGGGYSSTATRVK